MAVWAAPAARVLLGTGSLPANRAQRRSRLSPSGAAGKSRRGKAPKSNRSYTAPRGRTLAAEHPGAQSATPPVLALHQPGRLRQKPNEASPVPHGTTCQPQHHAQSCNRAAQDPQEYPIKSPAMAHPRSDGAEASTAGEMASLPSCAKHDKTFKQSHTASAMELCSEKQELVMPTGAVGQRQAGIRLGCRAARCVPAVAVYLTPRAADRVSGLSHSLAEVGILHPLPIQHPKEHQGQLRGCLLLARRQMAIIIPTKFHGNFHGPGPEAVAAARGRGSPLSPGTVTKSCLCHMHAV